MSVLLTVSILPSIAGCQSPSGSGVVRPPASAVVRYRRRPRTVVRGRGTGANWGGCEKGLEERGDLDFDRTAHQLVAHSTRPDIDLNEVRDRVKTDKFRSPVDVDVAEFGVDLDDLGLAARIDQPEI